MPDARPITKGLLSEIQEPTSFITDVPVHWPLMHVPPPVREWSASYFHECTLKSCLPPQGVPSKKFCCIL